MAIGDLSYNDYLSRIDIQEALQYAGYKFERSGSGANYKNYVKKDSNGTTISKFVVNARHNTAFNTSDDRKTLNLISLIKEHASEFPGYTPGKNPHLFVNEVCRNILNLPEPQRNEYVVSAAHTPKPFHRENFEEISFVPKEFNSAKPFYPYFRPRGIDITTQRAFHNNFVLATRKQANGNLGIPNLAFPYQIPGKDGKDGLVVGFEVRGRQKRDGTSYKGMAEGTNSSNGAWIASPEGTLLKDAKHVFLFESAYDAMAFFQLKTKDKNSEYSRSDLYKAVYISSGGTVTQGQLNGILKTNPTANYHLGFDNDKAGNHFVKDFNDAVSRLYPASAAAIEFKNTPGKIGLDHEKESAFFKLPDDVKQLYFDAEKLSEEYSTAYLCEEDKADLLKKIQSKYKEFDKAVDGLVVNVERMTPSEGNKDWNEQLLDEEEPEKEVKVQSGVDIDGDNIIEGNEQAEETHKSVSQHRR